MLDPTHLCRIGVGLVSDPTHLCRFGVGLVSDPTHLCRIGVGSVSANLTGWCRMCRIGVGSNTFVSDRWQFSKKKKDGIERKG